MKLLRVGRAAEPVSIGGTISLAFRDSMSSCKPARVSCVAALGCNEAGELVTHLGEHPSLKIGALLETHKHGINDILLESLEAEKEGLKLYKQLFEVVRDRSVLLEDYARRMISEEEIHIGEVNKMLRKPGDITPFSASK